MRRFPERHPWLYEGWRRVVEYLVVAASAGSVRTLSAGTEVYGPVDREGDCAYFECRGESRLYRCHVDDFVDQTEPIVQAAPSQPAVLV